MSAAKRAKQGGMNLNEMCEILGYSRQHLHRIFKENPQRFDIMLFDAMREKCIRQIRAIKNEQL
jgi:AraC-like DNA-binding protein